MGSSIQEHQRNDLTGKNEIFGGLLSRNLIAQDMHFQPDYLRTTAKKPSLSGMKNLTSQIDKSSSISECHFQQPSFQTHTI